MVRTTPWSWGCIGFLRNTFPLQSHPHTRIHTCFPMFFSNLPSTLHPEIRVVSRSVTKCQAKLANYYGLDLRRSVLGNGGTVSLLIVRSVGSDLKTEIGPELNCVYYCVRLSEYETVVARSSCVYPLGRIYDRHGWWLPQADTSIYVHVHNIPRHIVHVYRLRIFICACRSHRRLELKYKHKLCRFHDPSSVQGTFTLFLYSSPQKLSKIVMSDSSIVPATSSSIGLEFFLSLATLLPV